MPIFTSMTTVTEALASRCQRSLAGAFAAFALAVGLTCAPAHAANKDSSHSTVVKATSEEPHLSGTVLRNGIRLEDEIDVVNTRTICGVGDSEFMRRGIKVETYAVCDDAGGRKWKSSDLDSFLQYDPTVPTIFFVHGNQIGPGDAKAEGLMLYRNIILQGCDAPRIRFVIFSWPSSKVAGLLRDVREKAARTEPAGYHLAWLLDQMPAETPVSLVGFSFGARIITGGLHVLAGGSLESMSLKEHVHPHREPVNAVLIAAASHSYWLGEGQHHGRAMSEINRVLFINNCEDRAMRYYGLITPGRGGPQAMGLCGPTQVSRKEVGKIFNRDVSGYVGAQHELTSYICAPGDAGLIWDYAGPGAAVEKGSKIGG